MDRENPLLKATSYTLICILVISIIGTVSVPISAEENIFQKDTYITQFGPGFDETEIASSADNLDVPRDLEFHPNLLDRTNYGL